MIGSMVNRSNSERLRGFDFRRTDRQTDGRTFAIVESLSRKLKINSNLLSAIVQEEEVEVHDQVSYKDV